MIALCARHAPSGRPGWESPESGHGPTAPCKDCTIADLQSQIRDLRASSDPAPDIPAASIAAEGLALLDALHTADNYRDLWATREAWQAWQRDHLRPILAAAAEPLDERLDAGGNSLPYGRCDTCGAPCDANGCTVNAGHEIADTSTNEPAPDVSAAERTTRYDGGRP